MAVELAYHHDRQGVRLAGAADRLITAIREGRRVRAVLVDEIGLVAYDHFTTLRVNSNEQTVTAVLPLRPAADNYANLIDTFALFEAVVNTKGTYTWRYGPPLESTGGSRQFEIMWYVE